MLTAYEDRRFRDHPGVDARALLRAAGQWLAAGRIVSGASTLSMQVARLVEPRGERSLKAKLRQIARAIELERRLGKDGVLRLYLALAPYGGPVEGLRAASLAYFGREPARLTLAEAALLVALPRRRRGGGPTGSRRPPAGPATGCSTSRPPGAWCRRRKPPPPRPSRYRTGESPSRCSLPTPPRRPWRRSRP